MENNRYPEMLSQIVEEHSKAEAYRVANTTNRYPAEFKAKVNSAMENGLTAMKIHRATGLKISTILSWRKDPESDAELVCFEPVFTQSENRDLCKLVFPSGALISLPISFVDRRIDSWLGSGKIA